jgi:L-malate glycosyltransferase
MKVLHILYAGLGGHANVFASMVAADTNSQFNFEALYNGIEPMRESYKEFCVANKLPFYYVAKKRGLHVGFYFSLYKAIKKAKPNILFLHGGGAIVPAKLYKLLHKSCKLIVVRETQANHLKLRNDWINLKLSMLLADKMVYLSEEYNREVESSLPKLYKAKKSFVIPNGLNLDLFKAVKKANNLGVFKIGMAARMTNIKDHDTLVKAFAIITEKFGNNIQLLLAGDGTEKPVLENLVKKLNLQEQVIFVGLLNEQELANYLNSLDIYVHATFGETMSTAIMQAMACGLPIVASKVLGVNNMITHNQNGLLVQVKNSKVLAQTLEKLLLDELLRLELGKAAGIKASSDFSNEKMFEKYKTIFLNQ